MDIISMILARNQSGSNGSSSDVIPTVELDTLIQVDPDTPTTLTVEESAKIANYLNSKKQIFLKFNICLEDVLFNITSLFNVTEILEYGDFFYTSTIYSAMNIICVSIFPSDTDSSLKVVSTHCVYLDTLG